MNSQLTFKEIESMWKEYSKNTIVILIGGKAGTGKSTVGNILLNLFSVEGKRVLKTAFAKGVKECATRCFLWDGVKDDKGRELLQGVGNLGRNYFQDIWANKVKDEALEAFLDVVIVDDFRFVNEYEVLKNVNGLDVYTIKMNAPNREILKGTPYYNDISETSLDDFENWDFILDNTGSREALYWRVKGIYNKIMEG